ncbi:hypothetical protein ES288_D11G258100v1 [Gossypium darwinii]|uniref:UDP-3-O-acyl-N-acetylglucosamine deacetylase n=1 Tax=Gossypium darwinii TaxID=34276 RepID=A0A5D2APW5_GOSDA|nr:hypothetical protein ES288_D11G258100v1 [Gossypium darwinii]
MKALFSESSNLISWKTTGKLQQTLAGCIKLSGKTGQSGKVSKVKIWPGFTGQGRYFEFHSNLIPASIDFVRESLLCTSLCKDGYKIRTVEHLLSALEAKGIDNCRIQIQSLDSEDTEVEKSDFSCKVLLDNKMHDFTLTWNKYIFNCSFTSRQLWSKLKA